jgi:hypothetical protein
LQLDRIPPRSDIPDENPGTLPASDGVEPIESAVEDDAHADALAQIEAAVHIEPRRRPKFRDWMALSMVCGSLLGQGEVCRVDERFTTPSATIVTYWQALRDGNLDEVTDCFADPALAEPRPGMVWFLPPTDELEVHAVRYAPGEDGHVLATYEIRFRPRGSTEELSFITGSELARIRGEWRLVGIADDISWPEWNVPPHPVDI